ncbi:MAG: helix-turn-helix transcriptional regulator [Planctomycetes bacterium]|nr:helix-turn-helix transcriptional regulator [Planctomycetota bacterium]
MPRRPHPAYLHASPLVAFAERVRALRVAHGWSQEELAHRAGRHFTFVSQLERAERSPGLMTIVQVADALGVDPGDLVTRRPFVAEKLANDPPRPRPRSRPPNR